ncbi:MAG: FAD-dependent oxidoreductase [Lachnospiraceae bacterium]|nr:FAD-dependent oxidoreductase [Lachnospiraceae bacterium]MBR5765984.1 FAD-dependent oxidoreductase [Lachnospiraceae bacterium]
MKYLILGAGPAGLTFANRLLQNGIDDFLVIEKENEAGGLCRSREVDRSPLDTGGGHFLDVKNPIVLDFLFEFMPKEMWDEYERDSRIVVNGNTINSPIEANIWQLSLKDQVEYLKSIAIAGCNLGTEMPEKFVDWIYWKLGNKIAEDYMIPYNRKMFGENLDELGTYWLNKLPNVSFEETLISCLEKKAYGTQPGHARFLYPKKYGYGELWLRLAEKLGDRIRYNVSVEKLDLDTLTVNDTYTAENIVTTIPWSDIKEIKGVDRETQEDIGKLKHSSTVIEYTDEKLDTKAHWIYYPDPNLSYHRILVRHNFCPGSKGYWTETNLSRFDEKGKDENYYFINKYAYPLNTVGKQEIMKKLLNKAAEKKVYGLGRWGEWQHYNSDVVVALGIELADKLSK